LPNDKGNKTYKVEQTLQVRQPKEKNATLNPQSGTAAGPARFLKPCRSKSDLNFEKQQK